MTTTFPAKQSKFSNGAISSLLYGDTLHPKYAASLKVCQNWVPVPQGALVKRPGFAFVAPVKDNSYIARLIPFVFSDDQTFVLEFGNLYARFYQRSKYVGNDGNLHTFGDAYGGGYYELVTPFTTAMLPYLKFSQVGNVVTICYGGQAVGTVALAPRDLSHTTGALTPWTIGVTPTKIPAGAVTWNTPMVDGVVAWNGGVTYNQGDRVFVVYAGGNVEWVSLQAANLNNAPPAAPAINAAGTGIAGNIWWVPAVDTSHQAAALVWCETVVVQDAAGVVYESDPSAEIALSSSLSPERPRQFIRAGFTLAGGYTALYQRVYRKTKNGSYGWLFDHAMTTPFQDDGRAPDYTKQPPKGTDPFLVNGADSYPSVIGYLDQRRLWAGPLLLPSTFVLSKVGDLYNYDIRNIPGADTDAMQVLLAAVKLEQIRSFIPKKRGLLLTSQGEWAVSGQGGSPVSRSNIDAKQQSEWGSSWLNPISIGTGILFNTAKSNMVRDLYPLYGLYADNWDGQDLSVMARHFFDLHTLKDWAFQSTPYPVVWAVRDDGVLLSLTYQHAPPSFGQQLSEGIVAWASHVSGVSTDKFEAVCSVPEPPEDAVYVIAQRRSNGALVRYIERMESPVCPASPYLSGVSDVRYGRYLDSVTTYDGHNDKIGFPVSNAQLDSVAAPLSVNLADYTAGKQIFIDVAGGPFVAGDAANPYGSRFVFDPENTLGVGSFKAKIIGYTSATRVTAELLSDLTLAQLQAWSAGYAMSQIKWGIAKGSFALLNINAYAIDSNNANLARGMICLADGDVQVPAAGTTAGVLKLDVPALVIHVGIAYNCDVSLLDLWHPSIELRNRFGNIVRMGFEVAGTRDMWVGKDFANLAQWEQRSVLDAYGVMGLATGYFEADITGEWGKGKGGAVRHFQPLPAVLVSVLREVALGGT